MKRSTKQQQCNVTSPDQNEFLSVQQTARLLDVNPKTIYAAIREGTLPGVLRIGRTIRINRQALVDWTSNERVPS